MVEVGDLLAEDEVLQERGAAQPGLERVLIVGDRLREVRGEDLPAGIDPRPVQGGRPRILPGFAGAPGFG